MTTLPAARDARFFRKNGVRRRACRRLGGRARSLGIRFFDAPVVETLELLKRKAGEEITDQIYNFTDKRRELALRPS